MTEAHDAADLKPFASAAELPKGCYVIVDMLNGEPLAGRNIAVDLVDVMIVISPLVDRYLLPTTNISLSQIRGYTVVAADLAWKCASLALPGWLPIGVMMQCPPDLKTRIIKQAIQRALSSQSPQETVLDAILGTGRDRRAGSP